MSGRSIPTSVVDWGRPVTNEQKAKKDWKLAKSKAKLLARNANIN